MSYLNLPPPPTFTGGFNITPPTFGGFVAPSVTTPRFPPPPSFSSTSIPGPSFQPSSITSPRFELNIPPPVISPSISSLSSVISPTTSVPFTSPTTSVPFTSAVVSSTVFPTGGFNPPVFTGSSGTSKEPEFSAGKSQFSTFQQPNINQLLSGLTISPKISELTKTLPKWTPRGQIQLFRPPETAASQYQQPSAFQPQTFQPQTFQPQTFQPSTFQPQTFQSQTFQPQPQTFQPQTFQPQSQTFQPQPQTFQPPAPSIPMPNLPSSVLITSATSQFQPKQKGKPKKKAARDEDDDENGDEDEEEENGEGEDEDEEEEEYTDED